MRTCKHCKWGWVHEMTAIESTFYIVRFTPALGVACHARPGNGVKVSPANWCREWEAAGDERTAHIEAVEAAIAADLDGARAAPPEPLRLASEPPPLPLLTRIWRNITGA